MTQRGLRPQTLAMVLGPSFCSCRSAQTTRASSMGDSVRGGRLASSRATICSETERGASTSTGTRSRPSRRQCANRLKPSISS